jgi:hypothetical protein
MAPIGFAVIDTDGVTGCTTVIVITFDVAVVGFTQVKLDVNTTLTWSPFVKADVVKVVPVATLAPFSFHCKPGSPPPLTGVAVNVTDVPAHICPAGFAVIVTDGTTTGETCIVIELDVTVAGCTQFALDVKSKVTTSPLL